MIKNANDSDAPESQDTETSGGLPLLFIAGLALVFTGIIVIIAASVLSGTGSSVSGGIIIFIGPFPIVIGAGPDASWLVLVGIILAIISLISFILLRRRVWIVN